MIVQDDRTEEQRKTHVFLVVGTDPFMSGWGQCQDGSSYAAWACTEDQWDDCERWVKKRGDLKRIRGVWDPTHAPYRPNASYCGHLHIYAWNK